MLTIEELRELIERELTEEDRAALAKTRKEYMRLRDDDFTVTGFPGLIPIKISEGHLDLLRRLLYTEIADRPDNVEAKALLAVLNFEKKVLLGCMAE